MGNSKIEKQNIKNSRIARIGIKTGLMSGFTWAIDVILVSIILSYTGFIKDKKLITLLPFVCAFLKDSFSFIWVSLFTFYKGEFKGIIKRTKSKSGRYVILGALVGGPIGMSCYMLSIKYLGPAYTANVSSIYPVISAICGVIFLKEVLDFKNKIGIILSVVGVSLISYSSEGSGALNFKFGIIMALLTALCWGLESVICSAGMKDDEINSNQAFNIRQMISAIFYGAVIIPSIKAWPLVCEIFKSKIIILLIITSIISSISYLLWYKSINSIGAAKSTALNVTYVVWTIVLQWIFLKTPLTIRFIIGSFILFIGITFVVGVWKHSDM